MNKTEERRRKEADFINKSPITLTAADIAKLFSISKPTACEDVRYLLSNYLVPKNKVRHKNILKEIFGIK